MNTPNKLTVLRILLVFPAVLFVLYTHIPGRWLFTFLIFAFASYTDYLDGKIARKYNLVTNFGKFMDPLADKLLVCSALICLVSLARIPAWIVIIIVAREFTISGFRLIAAEQGTVIAASYFGKFKTTFQMIMVILMIMDLPQLNLLTQIVMWAALILTVLSLIDYLYKNRSVLKETD